MNRPWWVYVLLGSGIAWACWWSIGFAGLIMCSANPTTNPLTLAEPWVQAKVVRDMLALINTIGEACLATVLEPGLTLIRMGVVRQTDEFAFAAVPISSALWAVPGGIGGMAWYRVASHTRAK